MQRCELYYVLLPESITYQIQSNLINPVCKTPTPPVSNLRPIDCKGKHWSVFNGAYANLPFELHHQSLMTDFVST